MKLARWKSQYLSLRGRLTLINSMFDALPTYVARTLHFCKQTRLDATLVRARVRVGFGQSDPDTLTRAEKKIWGKGDQFLVTSSERRRSHTKLEKVQRRREEERGVFS
ncbi:hypothetical protein MTR67_003167 [Solanum verrucosum]|uniref:Uncharacterized protein n=1 Tax=Solanum verrucosum TaxID=315347 RepID=A0AAF0PSC7_SOLVR|nr:hypothetical protein MTR67_003167 [Solanum verrucosum]